MNLQVLLFFFFLFLHPGPAIQNKCCDGNGRIKDGKQGKKAH